MEQNRDQDNDLFNFDNQPQEPGPGKEQPLEPVEEQPAAASGGAQSYPAPTEPEHGPVVPEPPGPAPEYVPPPPMPSQPPARSNLAWLLILIIVLVLLCCCCFLAAVIMYQWGGDWILCRLFPTYYYCP